MTDISQIVRWNANFVRGLAQSVLDRAKAIRTSLTPNPGAVEHSASSSAPKATAKRKSAKAKLTKKTRPAAKSKRRTGKNG